jgi:hypothetical protein
MPGSTSYADGRPFDEVHYFQLKVPLKADRFTSVDDFRNFASLVRRTADRADVGFDKDPKTHRSPLVREVVFVDTPDFRLYNHGFILRRRVSYIDGFAVGDPEIVFKFRHPDKVMAASVDVRPNIQGSYRIKFKMQKLSLASHGPGSRALYSHNCQFPVTHVRERDRTALTTLVRVFPALGALQTSNEERLRLVNEGIVEELLLPAGWLDFGKGICAKSNVALWRTRADHVPLAAEFSFQIGFDRPEDFCDKARARAKQFSVALQRRAHDWISRGTTKTALVYRLKNGAAERLE